MEDMEKITQQIGSGDYGEAATSEWLRLLMASITSYDENNVLLPVEGRAKVQPVKSKVEPEARHSSGLHSHAYPEICVSVGGTAFMELEDGIYEMASPSIFFVLPHTTHCEVAGTDRDPYALCWLAYSEDVILCNSSIYCSEDGWSNASRSSLEGEDVRDLSETLECLRNRSVEINGEKTGGKDVIEKDSGPGVRTRIQGLLKLIRAKLIDVINRMYQRSVRMENSNQSENKDALDYHEQVLRYVRKYIDDNLDQRTTLRELGEMARLSPNYLNELFKEWMGEPLHQYAIRRRMERARRLLQEGDLLVKQIAREVGYSDPLYFSRAFHEYFGQWPTDVEAG